MSSSTSLQLELRPSRWLQFALCGLALGAALAIWRSSVPNEAFGLIPLLLSLSLWGLHRQVRGWLLLHEDGRALWQGVALAEQLEDLKLALAQLVEDLGYA